HAQAARPLILYTFPAGLQRGQTTQVTAAGPADFAGAYRVLIQGTGVTAEVVSTTPPWDGKPETINSAQIPDVGGGAAPTPATITVRVTAAPDAEPGLREFRVATPRGISNASWLAIGDEAEVLEKEPNDTPAAAQPVGEAGTVNGRLDREGDRDVYRFSV